MYLKIKSTKGFTLIELLVVIAIIGLLASVVLASLNTARAKGRDAKKIQELKSINTAFALYYDTHKSFAGLTQVPPATIPCSRGAGVAGTEWDRIMGILVTQNFLGSIPRSPTPGALGAYDGDYCYHNYGAGVIPVGATSQPGAMIVTELEAATPSTTGYGGCRPYTGSTWCSDTSGNTPGGPNTFYCLCNPW